MEDTEKTIEDLRKGRAGAFEKLFRQWKNPVYGYVLKMVGDHANAQDITQEVFIRVLKAVGSYRHKGRFRQWLFTIASNLVTDSARKNSRRREVNLDKDYFESSRGCEFRNAKSDTEIREELLKAVDKLPPEQRSVLLLRQYGGLTFREIAALDGCSINTALSRMQYALANLRKSLVELSGETKKNELQGN